MAVPKKKTSKAKRNQRSATWKAAPDKRPQNKKFQEKQIYSGTGSGRFLFTGFINNLIVFAKTTEEAGAFSRKKGNDYLLGWIKSIQLITKFIF